MNRWSLLRRDFLGWLAVSAGLGVFETALLAFQRPEINPFAAIDLLDLLISAIVLNSLMILPVSAGHFLLYSRLLGDRDRRAQGRNTFLFHLVVFLALAFTIFIGRRLIFTIPAAIVIATALWFGLIYTPRRLARMFALGVTVSLLAFLSYEFARPFYSLKSLREVRNEDRSLPNVLLVLVDTLRADRLSTYGYSRETSPFISRLAGEGVKFTNFYANASWTPPATATILTGVFPSVHGINGTSFQKKAPVKALCEILRGRGYNTAAFIANPLITESSGLLVGCDYHNPMWNPFRRNHQRSSVPNPPIYPSLILASEPSLENVFVWKKFVFLPRILVWKKFVSLSDRVVTSLFIVDRKKSHLLRRAFRLIQEVDGDGNDNREEIENRNPRADEFTRGVLNYVDYVTFVENYDGQRTKFFVYLHYLDPHAPYEPPEPYDRLFDPRYPGERLTWHPDPSEDGTTPELPDAELHNLQAQYDGETRYFDDNFQFLFSNLEERGFLDNTLIVFVSDHGEEFYEHRGFGHGGTVFEEVLRVPLILWYPGSLPAGLEVEGSGSQVDLMPTLMELLGLPGLGDFQGRSLLPLVYGEETSAAIYGESSREPPGRELSSHRFLVRGRYKFINQEKPETEQERFLFDLQLDPNEQENIYGSEKKIAEEMESLLEHFITLVENDPRYSENLEPVEVDPELQERLRALGYVE